MNKSYGLLLVVLLTAAFLNLLSSGLSEKATTSSTPNEWIMFQNDLNRTGFLNASSSPLITQISLLWKHEIEAIVCSPFASDLNGDGKIEVVIGTQNGVGCIDNNGSLVWFCPINSLGSFPTISDLDKIGGKEVIVSSGDGMVRCLNGATGELIWSTQTSGGGWTDYPSVADLDGDGQLEVISISDYVTVLNNSGSKIWEKRVNALTLPAIADVNVDGKLEIVLNTYGQGLQSLVQVTILLALGFSKRTIAEIKPALSLKL